MDGTLLDSETISTVATDYGFRKVLGRELTPEESSQLVGRPVKKVLSQWFPEKGDLIYDTGRRYFESRIPEIRPYPRIREVVEDLSLKYRLAVVTSSHRADAEKLLSMAGLRQFFLFYIGQEDTNYQKPDPEPVLLALQKLKVTPREAVFVGDQPYDIIAAHEAGMIAIGAIWGSGNRDLLEIYHPEMILSAPDELPAFLMKMRESI